MPGRGLLFLVVKSHRFVKSGTLPAWDMLQVLLDKASGPLR